MPIILDEMKLSYTPVPKTACTSLKTLFFEVENGREFIPFKRNGREFHIHNVYPSVFFNPKLTERQSEYSRFLLVRDPILRLLSAYSNRVVHHGELSREKARKQLVAHDLAPNPSLVEFVHKLPIYMKAVETIDHHTRPLIDFAGPEANFYTRIYNMSEIDEMLAEIASIVGQPLKLQRLQTGGPKLSLEDLGSREIERLREFYAGDYSEYGDHF